MHTSGDTNRDLKVQSLYAWLQETGVEGVSLTKIRGLKVVGDGIGGVVHETQLKPSKPRPAARPVFHYVLQIPQGEVRGQFGVVVTPDGVVLPESTLIDAIQFPVKNTYVNNSEVIELAGPVATIASQGYYTYGHVILDVLPRLCLLEAAHRSYKTLLVSPLVQDYQYELLDRAGVGAEKIRQCSPQTCFIAEKLLMPSFVGATASTADVHTGIEFIRWFQELFPIKRPRSPKRRIYCSRARAPHRRLANEDVVIEILSRYQFEVLYMEDYSMAEKVKIMSEAAIVIGGSGSNFVNILFCQPGTVVVELITRDYSYFNGVITLALKLGLHYSRYLTQPVPGPSQVHWVVDHAVDPGEFGDFMADLMTVL